MGPRDQSQGFRLGTWGAQTPRVARRAGRDVRDPGRPTEGRHLEGNALTRTSVKVLRTTSRKQATSPLPKRATGMNRLPRQSGRTRTHGNSRLGGVRKMRTKTTATLPHTHQTGKNHGSDDVRHWVGSVTCHRRTVPFPWVKLNRSHTRPGNPGSTWVRRVPRCCCEADGAHGGAVCGAEQPDRSTSPRERVDKLQRVRATRFYASVGHKSVARHEHSGVSEKKLNEKKRAQEGGRWCALVLRR